MTTMQRLGNVIKNMRTARGLSQEQLALECGIDQHYLSNIENGQRNVSVEMVERISSYFGLKLSEMFAAAEVVMHTPPLTHVVSAPRTAAYTPVPVSADILQDQFERYMRRKGLSNATVVKYAHGTPNSASVQTIINRRSGTTHNMFEVTDLNILDRIVLDVESSHFNIVGNHMYSAGLKKYIAFLEEVYHLTR